jgi:hypothetical protein
MAKASRAPAQREKETKAEAAEQHELQCLPNAEKLMAFAGGLTSGPADKPQAKAAKKKAAPQPEAQAPKRFAAAEAACEAGKQIEALVRMKVDAVTAVIRSEAGWDVVVNVVELPRIPHSTDLLAAYNVCLDAEGNLVSYNRGTRYTRGQTGDGL